MLREPALQFRAAPAKTDIPPESNMRDRVHHPTADVLANPTHRKNPAPGKLNGVDDFIVLPFANPLRRGHRLADRPSVLNRAEVF